uniref:G-protein coupled receptors family 3 profile domain-containing protein n=1 Tax=Hucho hucho TaxID=62062 RepID=A0A4W5LW28_9TELE
MTTAVLYNYFVMTPLTHTFFLEECGSEVSPLPPHICRLMAGPSALPVLQREGDVILGGLFSLHDMVLQPDLSFTFKPAPTRCTGLLTKKGFCVRLIPLSSPLPCRFNFRTFRWMQTMMFAIEEINRDDHLLPNFTLGYKIYDSCSTPYHALRASVELMGVEGEGEGELLFPLILSVSVSVSVSLSLSLSLSLSQVSYFSSCACLSNKAEFPAFLRTMPSDFFQVDALVQLVQHFSWKWVGVVAGDDAYGRGGAQIFSEEKLGACVALLEIIPKNHAEGAMASIVARIRSSAAGVVLVFALEQDAGALFDEALRQGLTGVQWLASEAWSTASVLSTPPRFLPILQGSMGFAIRRAVHIPGLQEFLLRLHPSSPDASKDPFLRPFWEEVFGCSLQGDGGGDSQRGKPLCSGSEDLGSVRNIYSDVSQLRISYNVYKAVYAIAHTLHAMRSCETGRGPFPLHACPDTDRVQPWQLLHYLKQVEFSNSFGDETKFDVNGDPVAVYDLVNWQLGAEVCGLPPPQVPLSVCSSSCPPGTRRAIRPHFPICCFDCVVCTAGEISNQTGEAKCVRCLPEFWSNKECTACIPKQVDFLSFNDTMGMALLSVALLGSFCTATVVLIFACHHATPIVRANNSELSFLLLFSLTLCFLCSLTFIGRPSEWSCMLRHTAFGITFVLCISCVLGKTIVVLMAFRATLPGSNVRKWFGPPQQRAFISLCTLVQVVICAVWLAVSPPSPHRLMTRESACVILLCDEGSALGFCLVLGYIGLLASLCLLLAFLARKLPDNFNEAKLITFSMLIFCAVWVAFVPAYVSSPGKYSTATEVFAILGSSYGLLTCLFLPKCYIILLKPEKNNRKHLMAKSAPDKTF